jgi:PIN domain nuclease of toxin-antitoxin system
MKILLDTNALLWSAYAPERLTKNASKAYLAAEELCFSILSPWEIALKFSRGGFHDLKVPENWETSLIQGLLTQGLRLLKLDVAHCRRVQDLPFHHKDPFDRMLIAQALAENLTVIGSDDRFDDYGVKRIW